MSEQLPYLPVLNCKWKKEKSQLMLPTNPPLEQHIISRIKAWRGGALNTHLFSMAWGEVLIKETFDFSKCWLNFFK